MTTLTAELRIRQGASWAYAIGIDSDVVNPAWTVRAQVRKTADADGVLHTWSTLIGNAVLGTATVEGESLTSLTLTATPAESLAWEWCRGVYDVQVVSPDGLTALTVLQGGVSVEKAVTR